MSNKIYLIVWLSLLYIGVLPAQFYERDSIWVSGVLSLGGEYRLNDETWDAIRRGNFLNMGENGFHFSPSFIPLEMDFDLKPDNDYLFHGLDLWHISTDDVVIFRPLGDSILIVRSGAFTDYNDFLIREYALIPHSLVEVNEMDYLPEIQVWDGEWRGSLKGAARINYSAEDVLEDVFSPAERQKHKNRKEADAWKYYNMEPLTPE